MNFQFWMDHNQHCINELSVTISSIWVVSKLRLIYCWNSECCSCCSKQWAEWWTGIPDNSHLEHILLAPGLQWTYSQDYYDCTIITALVSTPLEQLMEDSIWLYVVTCSGWGELKRLYKQWTTPVHILLAWDFRFAWFSCCHRFSLELHITTPQETMRNILGYWHGLRK